MNSTRARCILPTGLLLAAALLAGAPAFGQTNDGAVGGDAGMLQLVLGGDDARSAIDFDVHRYAGCYFVTF